MLKKINVTLVGAGHYARDLAYPLYSKNPRCNVKATISPHSSIPGVPVFKSVQEWEDCYGRAKEDDVFDMCVFADAINPLLFAIAEIGGKKFVLPKPISEDVTDLLRLFSLRDKYNAEIYVASQWFYENEIYEKSKWERGIVKIIFEESFENDNYGAFNSFLPHALQMCHSMYIEGFGKTYFPNRPSKKRFEIWTGIVRPVIIEINLGCHRKTRTIRIGKTEYNLLGRHEPFTIMIDSMVKGFCGEPVIIQTLDNYYPIAKQYLDIKKNAGFCV